MSAIGYKNHKVLIGILTNAWHPKLLEVLLWLTVRYSTIIFTSAYRPHKIHSDDSGIHSTIPLRAFDLRSRVFSDPQKIADDINAHFIYDPARPNLNLNVYHDTGQGHHFHIQVHPRTDYRTL